MNPETQWTVYRTRFLVRARQLTEPLVFTDALGREQSGRPGDYLVESSDGMRRITSQALFEDIYVPLTHLETHQNAKLWSGPRRAPRPARSPRRTRGARPCHRLRPGFQVPDFLKRIAGLRDLETCHISQLGTLTTFELPDIVFSS